MLEAVEVDNLRPRRCIGPRNRNPGFTAPDPVEQTPGYRQPLTDPDGIRRRKRVCRRNLAQPGTGLRLNPV